MNEYRFNEREEIDDRPFLTKRKQSADEPKKAPKKRRPNHKTTAMAAMVGIAALFLTSCTPTLKARVRRREAYRVALCHQARACVAESVARCVAAGLERSCGTDESWGR